MQPGADGAHGAVQGRGGFLIALPFQIAERHHFAIALRKGRDGGSLEDRAKRVYVWNTRPKNLEYYTEKWNEFLAA